MKRIALHTAVVLATLAALYLLWEMREAVVLFLLSLAIAAALRPISGWLAKRGLPNSLALFAAYMFAIGIPLLLLLAAAAPIISQMRQAGDDIATAYQYVQQHWTKGHSWQRALEARLPPPAQLYQAVVGDKSASLLSMLAGATFSIAGGVIDLVLVLFLSVYWSLDRVHFERLWLSLLPVDERAETRRLWRSIEFEIGAYCRSEAVQSIVAALILGCGYAALGQPYPALLAAIGGLAWLIPWVGAPLAVTPLLILSLPSLASDSGASFLTVTLPAALYTLAVLLFLELAIEPRFFNRRRYNALLTAIVAIGLAQIWGVFGFIIGPPLAAVAQIVGWQWINRPKISDMSPVVLPQGAFDSRLQTIRSSVANAREARPELLSLTDRLETLVHQIDELTAAASGKTANGDSSAHWFASNTDGSSD